MQSRGLFDRRELTDGMAAERNICQAVLVAAMVRGILPGQVTAQEAAA